MNNLFAQGGIPVPTPRPYPGNEVAPVQPPMAAQQQQMPMPMQQPQQRQTLLQSLFRPQGVDPNQRAEAIRNLMIASGTAMANQGQGFGQTIQSLQAQGTEKAQQAKQASFTADWLESVNADPRLVAMAREGFGAQALQFHTAQTAKSQAPDAVRQFEYAKANGYTGTFVDFKNLSKQQNTTNVFGNVAPGYEQYQDPETGAVRQRLVEGSAAWREEQIAKQKWEELQAQKELGQEKKEIGANVVVQDIDRALTNIESGAKTGPDFLDINPTTGLIGSTLSAVPGTKAHDTKKLIDTVEANSGFDKLQAMRDASPTGGALGAVSGPEMDLLKAAIGNLSIAQDDVQLMDNLRRVKNIYLDIIHGPNAGPPRESLTFEQSPQTPGTTKNGVKWSVK